MNRKLLIEFGRFAMVGGIGFLVDASILYFLVSMHVSSILARAVSFPIALSSTLFLNRLWTFGAYKGNAPALTQALGYVAVQCFGMAINYMVYVLALLHTGRTPIGSVLALAFGSAAGLYSNFAFSKLFLFKSTKTKGL